MSNPLLSVPATGLTTAAAYLAAVAQDVANVDTPGFGASVPLVSEAASYPGRSASAAILGATAPGRLVLDAGSVVAATPTTWTGMPTPTGTPTNLAIAGAGFFAVETPAGTTAYTRAGSFTPDAMGRLVLPDGSRLLPPVIIPPGAQWSIAPDGAVSVQGVAGQPVMLARFSNPGALVSLGRNLWAPSPASGPPTFSTPGLNQTGTLVSGAVNTSGVGLSGTFTDLMAAQSAYEANAAALRSGQQVLQSLTSQPL